MQVPIIITTRKILKKWVLFICGLLFLSGLTSCNDNSDQLVNETVAIKHFNVNDLIEAQPSFINSDVKDQVVVVEGIVEDINYLNSRKTIILKGKKDANAFVLCDMQSNQNLNDIKLGQTLTIKGILKGALKDIILLNCIISNQDSYE